MARMSTRKRNNLPKRAFAGPGRSFPINDRSHARAAISGASRSFRAGNISKATEKRIQKRARAKLHSRSYRKGTRK
ncbi:MAG TPA: hypothetical protein VFU76_07910 [Terriglobales bacterium]|nr:hypothetical protein [Terriglobales bacterium]